MHDLLQNKEKFPSLPTRNLYLFLNTYQPIEILGYTEGQG